MKHRIWKKLASALLALILCVQLLPAAAMAALLDNGAAYNQEILAALADIVGSEDEAERYYAILQQYGLLDEDGSMPDSWDIWMDGAQVALEDLRALLDSGDYDPDHQLLVDNTPITLGNLKTILEIEDYLAYLQERYFDGHQWTAEQAAGLQSLMDQINSEGISLLSTDSTTVTSWPSGVNHNADVVVDAINVNSNNTVTFTFRLRNALAGQEVTFDYAAVSGTQPVAANQTGSVTLTMADNSKSVTINLKAVSASSTDPVRSSANLVCYLNLYNLKNAVFHANGKTATSVLVKGIDGTVAAADMPDASAAEFEYTKYYDNTVYDTPPTGVTLENALHNYKLDNKNPTLSQDFTLTKEQLTLIRWGIVNHAEIKQNFYQEDKSTWTDTKRGVPYGIHYSDGSYDTHVNTFGGLQRFVNSQNTSIDYWYSEYIEFSAVSEGYTFVEGKYGWWPNASAAGVSRDSRQPEHFDEVTTTTARSTDSLDADRFAEDGSFTITCQIVKDEYPTSPYGASATVSFSDTAAPEVLSVSAPSGNYYPGQVVPVTVTFSEPVNAATAAVKFNGTSTSYSAAVTSGYSNVLTFPYTVQDADNTTLSISSVTATDLSGLKLNSYNPGGSTKTGKVLSGVTLVTPNKADAITAVTATIEDELTAPVLKATVSFSSNAKLTQWVKFTQNADGAFVADGVHLLLDGETVIPITASSGGGTGVTGSSLTMEVPLDLITSGTAATHVVELVLDDELVIGKYAAVSQAPAVFITSMAAPALSVKDSTGENAYKYTVEGEGANTKNVIYPQDAPKITAAFTVPTDKTYSFASASKVTVFTADENGNQTPADPDAHFAWSSSDPTVAGIDANGVITPTGKAGDASFTITALNGGVAGKAVPSATSETLHFGTGLTPFLLIPNNALSSVAGQDVTVFWTSNLCDKNGANDTAFTVTVTKGSEPVYTTTVTGTAAAPAASVTIPGAQLKYAYGADETNLYTVTVTSAYNGVTYTAKATIDLASQPAVVTLDKLPTYYITDGTASVDIGWHIENFDRYGTDGGDTSDLFKLLITQGGEVVYSSSEPGDSTGTSGTYSGSYRLPIDPVNASRSDPTSYRTVYTVTIQAKNGSDSTWSYDSFMLYVYDADALKIWVDGKDQSGVTLSNVSKISRMSQSQILALKRDIYLKDIISVNYGDYAWNEIADQIAWASSDNNVATVNYQQGTLYENIENFSYVSYRPTTEFGLSGVGTGTATVTATHKLTGMNDTLKVDVETLKDKLYLFQCYPQGVTTLRYQDSTGQWKTATSDDTGAAAIYEANGIRSDVYCSATVNGVTYLGTFYLADLETGEGDWTKLERYPCNNLTLRRAAYAYLYVKNPDGTPYTGSITFRGGVYVNSDYKADAKFSFDGSYANKPGDEDQPVQLGSDGKLTVTMDQTQWELDGGAVSAQDDVSYVFEISQGNSTDYYPLLLTVDANVNEDTFVGSGEAIVNFRKNPESGAHPFIILQASLYTNYITPSNLLDYTGKAGPTDSLPEAQITTAVMWWGMERSEVSNPTLKLLTESGVSVAGGEGEYEIEQAPYPFVDEQITQYTVKLNESTLGGVLDSGKSTGAYLDYYADGENISRHESLSFQLCNMLGMGKVEEAQDIKTQLQNMGQYVGTDSSSAARAEIGEDDEFVYVALRLVSTDNYSTGDSKMFRIQITPTADPTKFLGFIEVNVGNMNDKDQVTGVYAQTDTSGKGDLDYKPGLNELMVAAQKRSIYSYLGDDYNKVLKRQGVRNLSMQLGGYAESLIYYNENSGKWEIQILNGGFNVGGGVSYTWNKNMMVGPVPFTASLTIGGTAEVSMDALSVSYFNGTTNTSGIGNDFLTELRIYLYLRFFAGVGIDYAVVAFKLGIYGQINLDMQFQWLNRPYMDTKDKIYNVADGTYNDSKLTDTIPANDVLGTPAMEVWESPYSELAGQHFQIDGQIGLEFVVRVLFLSYEQVLYSYSFNLLNKSTGDWTTIQKNWSQNQAAQQAAISALLGSNSLSVTSVGGQQMMSLNLAPTLESRDYLEDGRVWGDFGISLFSLDADSALKNLQYNSYPYANPVISDDGQLVVYLSDMNSADVADTRAAFAVRGGGLLSNAEYTDKGAIDDSGYGDSQVSLSGTENFAVAAWTRQTERINKDEGAALTDEDQMIMLNSSEIYAGVYKNGTWTTTALTENASADLAPVAAANGKTAIVAWRAVASSGKPVQNGDDSYMGVVNFDEKDTILYRIYKNGEWGETRTLYNGTSGAVKGITAAMLDDGTAAVAYTLDSDKKDSTISDREIYYAVIGSSGEVARNVRATNDAYLDENPQLTAVTFPSAGNEQRFVLGWYTEQAVSSDSASALDAGETETTNTTTSDVRLLDFDADGIYTQLLPDSISKVADAYDVSITPTFRFTKNSDSINDLSILWVERAETTGEDVDVEKDVLKGVKFYTYGQNSELISFTGAVDVAEMGGGTLIDHFDAYVSDAANNEIKAVILGTTYGENGTITKTAETVGGDTVSYTTPSRTTSMYTATETYSDKIDVPAILPEYETIKKGAATQIQFTVDNNGIHAISALEIEVGGTKTAYSDLNLLPGSSIQLWADYTVPETGVVDPDYTVTATFNETQGASGSAETGASSGIFGIGARAGSNIATGTVYLDLPDVEITDAKIVEEVDGNRTIQIKLNNDADAALAKDGRTVRIGFYTDVTCETPFPEGYGLDPITVSNSNDLAMLDEGGYSVQTTFEVGRYLTEKLSTEDNPLTELPDSGITVHMKAEVLEPDAAARSNEPVTLPEPIYSNNYAAVTCENLKTRTGKDVSVTSSFTVSGGDTIVTAYLQNNRLSQTQTGNVIVTLLDAGGEVLAQQQSYTGNSDNNGLITLKEEEKYTATFTFADVTNAARVQVVYSDLIIGADNTNLTSLLFSNIPSITLADFEPDADDIYRAAVSTDDLTSTAVTVVTESSLAKAAAYSNDNEDADAGKNTISKTVSLYPGETNTITVTVVNGNETRTYILTVQNNGDPVVTWPDENDALQVTYGTSVYYAADAATINLSASATPEEEAPAYQITYQWYSCDAEGSGKTKLPDQTASTLTVPNTTDAGVYYYRCEIIRHLVNGGTTSYWSSVASVQINPAEGNSVTLEGTEVIFDNNPHKLTSAAAAMDGSTLHYSTDGGKTWSETEPAFTSAGVHTVWVYAANPNYVDTAVMTADVVIQEKEGTQFKLETQPVSALYDSYPDEIKALYGDAGSLSSALTDAMKKMGISEQNISAYGAKLMFSLDGGKTWTEATAENFPAAGMTVTIPYPEGTNRSRYSFILKQLITDPLHTGKTAGAIDAVDITLTEDGIRFTADCLSALVLGWYLRPTSDPRYTVAAEDSEHGTFTVSPTRAGYNSTVTITAKPDDGYKVGKVTVTAQNGRELTVTSKGNNIYTFRMPAGGVSVDVSFVKSIEALPNPFTDVSEGAYYYDAVLWAVENGITSGTTAATFSPDASCTRAQAVAFLWRAAGSPAPKAAANPFTDVSTGAYYYDAVLWAVENGITVGTTATAFSPNQTCTRAQIVTFLWRASGAAVETAENPFTDVSSGAYYYDAVLWAVKNGITAGTSATTFSPRTNCTRAQIVAFLYRAKA